MDASTIILTFIGILLSVIAYFFKKWIGEVEKKQDQMLLGLTEIKGELKSISDKQNNTEKQVAVHQYRLDELDRKVGKS